MHTSVIHGPAPTPDSLAAVVQAVRLEAEGIVSLELRPLRGGSFPAYSAGAHVDVHLPGGLVRSYSLCGVAGDFRSYVIAVLHVNEGRGGSRYVHEHLRVGQGVWISPPRNLFPLRDGAAYSVLIAGGIGITPLLSMARQLAVDQAAHQLYYFARSRPRAAFLGELERLAVPMQARFDDAPEAGRDLRQILEAHPPAEHLHVYACGPRAMLDDFETIAAELGHRNAHIERFGGARGATDGAKRSEFSVHLARSGMTLGVPADRSVLEVLLDAGVQVPASCREGVCGTCETKVLAGTPDHRDAILSARERQEGKCMMVCVSRSCGGSLSLDL